MDQVNLVNALKARAGDGRNQTTYAFFLESSNERSVRLGRELGNIRERVAYSNA